MAQTSGRSVTNQRGEIPPLSHRRTKVNDALIYLSLIIFIGTALGGWK